MPARPLAHAVAVSSLALAVAAAPARADAPLAFTTSTTGNTADLVSAYCADKEHVFALSRDGLVLRSVDGGRTFAPRAIGQGGVRGGASRGGASPFVALGGLGPHDLWAAASDRLYHSNDTGETFEAAGARFDSPVSAIWVAGPGEVYAVGDKGAIRHTSDGGKSVTPDESGTESALAAVWGSGPGDVYAVGEGGTIVHESGGGAGFARVDAGVTADLVGVWGSGPNDVYAVGGSQVLHSTDGASFRVVWTAVGMGTFTRVFGGGKGDVWVPGSETVLRSTDGGKRFQSVKVPGSGSAGSPGSIRAIAGCGPDDVYLVGDKGLIVHGGKGGKWEVRHGLAGPGQEVLRAALSVGAGDVVVGGSLRLDGDKPSQSGEAGEILRSEDGGRSYGAAWRGGAGSVSSVEAIAADVSVARSERLFAVGAGGVVLRSDDGGKSWEAKRSGVKSRLRAVYAFGDDVFAGGDKGKLLHSKDGGTTWKEERSGTTLDVRGVAGSSAEDVFAACADLDKNTFAILHTVDGGKTWKTVKDGAGTALALAVAPAGKGGPPAVLAVGVDDSYASRLLRSTDGGATFTATGAGPGTPHALAVDAEGAIWLAGGGGSVLRSRDGGRSFVEEKTGTTADLEAITLTEGGVIAVGRDGALVIGGAKR